MAVQITSSMTELKLVSGNGRPTAANFTAAGPDVPLALGAGHVLRAMSGGETTVTLHELEVAMFLAVYVDRERVGDTVLVSSAWSLDSISAVFKSALQLGMETESRGSMRAALHYFVAGEARSGSLLRVASEGASGRGHSVMSSMRLHRGEDGGDGGFWEPHATGSTARVWSGPWRCGEGKGLAG